MKGKIRKIALPLLLLLMLGLTAATVSAESYFRQTKASATSFTLSWNYDKADGFESIRTQTLYWGTSRSVSTLRSKGTKVTLTSGTRAHTITGLKAGARYYAYLLFSYVPKSGGSKIYADFTDDAAGNYAITCFPLPAKVTGLKATFGKNHKQLLMQWYDPAVAPSGYQVEHLSQKGNRISIHTTNKFYFWKDYKVTTVQRFRVRAYHQINGQKFFGPWADKWFVPEPFVDAAGTYIIKKTGQMKVTWALVPGVLEYEVYVSSKPDTGYKKAARVQKPVNTIKINSYNGAKFKAGSTYYIKIKSISARGTSSTVYASLIKTAK